MIEQSALRVLIVDDFMTMRSIMSNLLRQMGIRRIDQAEDGLKALAKLRDGCYDLVLSDWNMPNMEGIDLLKAVRKDPALKHMPFIIVSAKGEGSHVIEAIKAGVDDYVLKPFTAEHLEGKIKRLRDKKKFCKQGEGDAA